MKKRKILLLLALSFILVFSLSSCHGNKALDKFVLPEEFDTSRDYEISFWAKNDTNITQVQIYEKAIADFEKLYPNIHVNMRKFTDYKVIYNEVITNIPTYTTPNVCISYPDHIATYLTGTNVVVPLDELIESTKYGLGGSEIKFDGPKQADIIDKFYKEGILDGKMYDLPFMRSTEALYINKTFVEKLGYKIPDIPTWDWIFEVSNAAMAKNADGTFKLNGQNVMIPFIYKSTDNQMITMLKQLGADYSTEAGDILLFNDTTKDVLKTIYKNSLTNAFSTFSIKGYPGNYLNAGQSVFGIDSTAGSTWMGSGAGHQDIDKSLIVDFETVVRPIPQFDVDNPVMISQGPSLCIFNKKDPQEVLASWIFTQYMLTNEVQIAYSQTEGYAPVTSLAQESEEYKDYLTRRGEDNDLYYSIKIDATKLLLDNTDNTFVTPVFNGSASLRTAAGALIEDVAYAPYRKHVVDEEYIDNLFTDIQARYRLNQLNTKKEDKKDLEKLPSTAVVMLVCIGLAWLIIAIWALVRYNKNKRIG